MAAERDPYFALADATRRAILDLLWDEGPLPAGAVARRFPAISRVAVSKHLRVLREAGLVALEVRGREAWYAFAPERLRALHEAWFARFAPLLEDSLETLKANVEAAPGDGRLGGAANSQQPTAVLRLPATTNSRRSKAAARFDRDE